MGDVVVVQTVSRDGWAALVGMVGPGEQPGTLMSDYSADAAPRLYLFGWWNGDSGLWQADPGGLDFRDTTTPPGQMAGVVKLSDLAEPHELTIHSAGRPPGAVRLSRMAGPDLGRPAEEVPPL